MNDFREEDYFTESQEYVDPISISISNGSGHVEKFRCMDYEFDGTFWKFVSLPPQRGKRVVRIISPSAITWMEIFEPEDRPLKEVIPSVAIERPRIVSGPQTYDAKGPDAIAEHRARRSAARPAHDERGIPMSVTINEHDGEMLVEAAMVKA